MLGMNSIFFYNYDGVYKNIAFIIENPSPSPQIVYIDDFELFVVPGCKRPTNFTYSNITGESIELSWDNNNSSNNWEIAYGPAGFDPDNANADILSAQNNENELLEDLSPLTEYDIYVRSVCDADNKSTWSKVLNITTPQIIGTIPFICDFEDEIQNGNWAYKNFNDVHTTRWYIGSATSKGDGKGLYISNNGGISNNSASISGPKPIAYTPINIPEEGTYRYSFDWKCNGDVKALFPSGYNYMRYFRVILIPTSVEPSPSIISPKTTPDGWVSLDDGHGIWGEANPQWITKKGVVEINTPGTYNIVFYWENAGNDFSNATQPPAAIDNISIKKSIGSIIDDVDIENLVESAYNVCAGTSESSVIALMAQQITISDTDESNYIVDLTWEVENYDPNIAGTYTATGNFDLPLGVVQSDPPKDLFLTTSVIVNDLPSVVCPENSTTTINNTITLVEGTPAGGTFSGANVNNNIFDLQNLNAGEYIITYTYADPVTTCSNFCTFTVEVTYPMLNIIDADNQIEPILTCLYTSAEDVEASFPQTMVITDTDNVRHTVNMDWELDTNYDPTDIGNTHMP